MFKSAQGLLQHKARYVVVTPKAQWHEIERLVDRCVWFKVYGIIEALYAQISFKGDFAKEINVCCIEEGIGWQLVNGKIVSRGDERFQQAAKTAASQLQENQRHTVAGHIQSAMKALSERPKANTPGAVAHATSALEWVLHDITGQTMTLGRYLDRHPPLFHLSLKEGARRAIWIRFRYGRTPWERRAGA